MKRKHLLLLALLCFFVSGALGVAYEVIWTRLLRLVFGSTVQATSAVLTLFMAGMAIGSFLIGRLADFRKDPLRIYALLELLTGLYAFLLPGLLSLSASLNTAITVGFSPPWSGILRLLLCGAVLIVPCSLMGATLPVMARLCTREKDAIGRTSGALYAINTFGAVCGAFLTGFFLIPSLGVSQTLFITAGMGCLIGIVLLLLPQPDIESLRAGERSTPAHEPAEAAGSEVRAAQEPDADKEPAPASGPETAAGTQSPHRLTSALFLAAFAVSGCTSMIYENIWTRLLGMIYGNTTYAFSSMLTVFLFGLALGSAIASRLTSRIRNHFLAFAVIQCLIGPSALLTFPLLKSFPSAFLHIFLNFSQNWTVISISRFIASLLVMGLPTLLFGAGFTFLASLYIKKPGEIGRSLGAAYAVNTVGCIAGAFMGGFVLMPLLGCQNALVVTIFINVFTGVLLIAATPGLHERPKALAICLFTVITSLGAFLLAGIDRSTLASGVYYSADRIAKELSQRKLSLDDFSTFERFLYYRDGADATVSVIKYRTQLALKINGKTDASTGAPDMITQTLVGQIPLLLSGSSGDVLVIGLGSGITLGSVLTHPVSRATCVEISPEVVEGAAFFSEYNSNALEDLRVTLLVRDARNHLQSTPERYDVIISEPSNPWLPGAAGLFTVESYMQMRRCLKPGGIVCQWMQNYNLDVPLYRCAVATFHSVFPHSMLWKRGGDTILIGSADPLTADSSKIEAGIARKEVKSDLSRIGIQGRKSLYSYFVLDEEEVGALSQGAVLNTDDRPVLEFQSSRMLSRYYRSEIEEALLKARKKNPEIDSRHAFPQNSMPLNQEKLNFLWCKTGEAGRRREGE